MPSFDEAVSRCWAEVDLTRLVQNYKNALSHLRPGVTLIAVLKANAYGLGAKKVAQTLWREGQRLFAVASFNEACELRGAVPGAEVLVLGLMSGAELDRAIAENMLITVFSPGYAGEVVRAAGRAGQIARVHVKIETGLHRLGFMPDEAAGAIEQMLASGRARLEGLFTHLALRDQASDRRQLDRLYAVRDALNARGVTVPMLHALDSIGMVCYPLDQMDAVRTGAWLYGVYPRGYAHPEESRLALTVKARVAQIHAVPAGECLGYDESHPLERDSVIATVSAGYIDGYPRQNNAGEVEVHGERARVVGLVCMDQMMIDVTDIPGVREGDEVTLLGGGIGVDEYAAWANLNRNESLARTGRRVPRVYYEEGRVAGIACDME